MKAIQILIVEDDSLIADDLSSELKELGIQTVKILPRGEEAIELVRQNSSIDLIIMDIELQGKLNGIETIRRIHEIQSIPVIVLSSKIKKEYIDDASDLAVYSYLPKPFNALTIKLSIEVALSLFKKEIAPYERFKGNVKIASKDKIFIKEKRKFFKVDKDDIMYVKADQNICALYLVDQSKHLLTTMSLLEFQKQFQFLELIKIHRSHIINKDKVASFYTENGRHFVILTENGKKNEITPNSTTLTISRKHWSDFLVEVRK